MIHQYAEDSTVFMYEHKQNYNTRILMTIQEFMPTVKNEFSVTNVADDIGVKSVGL